MRSASDRRRRRRVNLRIDRLIAAAELYDVDAIHPGTDSWPRTRTFAEVCESCKIKFIGPRPKAITAMGDKAEARKTMRAAGVPIIPGSDDVVQDEDEALKWAHKIGYPVIIKASAAGAAKACAWSTTTPA